MSMLFLPLKRYVARAFYEDGVLPGDGSGRAAVFLLNRSLSDKLLSIDAFFDLASKSVEFAALSEPEAAQQLSAPAIHCPMTFSAIESKLQALEIYFCPDQNEFKIPICYDFSFQAQFHDLMDTEEFKFCDDAQDHQSIDQLSEEFDPTNVDIDRRFQVRLRGTSDQRAVLERITKAWSDEHFYISAYAGTGKSKLVDAIASVDGLSCTYLAPFSAHDYAYQQRFSAATRDRLTFATFFDVLKATLATSCESGVEFERLIEKRSQRIRSVGQCAADVGVPRIGERSSAAVLQEINTIIKRFCHSDDALIQDCHLANQLDPPVAERPIYLAWAQRIWHLIFELTSGDRPIQLTLYHLAKWLTLKENVRIPDQFGTLLVDEAHDLSPSWLALLRRYSGRCILMGDPYQSWQRAAANPEMSHGSCLKMTQAYRTGMGGARWIKNTLELASGYAHLDQPFRGNTRKSTYVLHPSGQNEIPERGLWLLGDVWDLLEAVQRIHKSGGSFFVEPGSAEMLRTAVQGAIGLSSKAGDTFGAQLVDGYKTYEEWLTGLERRGYEKIVRLFERGYSLRKLAEALASQSKVDHQLTVCLLSQSRNLEFDEVCLSSGCVRQLHRMSAVAKQRGRTDSFAANLLYLGLSRTQHQLTLPGDALEQLKDLRSSDRSTAGFPRSRETLPALIPNQIGN